MSMNLRCEQVELWQTPTYITYMCYSNEDGGWQGILYRYEEWVLSQTDGVWDNESAYQKAKARQNYHLQELKDAAKKHGKLDFYIV